MASTRRVIIGVIGHGAAARTWRKAVIRQLVVLNTYRISAGRRTTVEV